MTQFGTRNQAVQSIAWFWDLYKRGLLDLDPPYQRRSVWNRQYREMFVETVLLQFPAPAIFMHEEMSPEGVAKYSVVDGKQRLTTIFDFVDGTFAVGDNSVLEHYRGKYFSSLDEADKLSLWRYQFSVEYLPSTEPATLTDIFHRINRNTSKLTAQELRHARYSGEFATSAEEMLLALERALPVGFPRIADSSRRQMKDVELVAQLLLLVERDEPQSFSQDDLDAAYAGRDEEWSERYEVEATFRAVLDYLAGLAPLIEARRVRNQADFYSLLGAVLQLRTEGLPDPASAATRLDTFMAETETDAGRAANEQAKRYYEAARSASNDLAQRRTRIEIIKSVLRE